MFFRDNEGKDFYILESAIPNEIYPAKKGIERLEVISTIAKTNL
jgi:hypothetical protein